MFRSFLIVWLGGVAIAASARQPIDLAGLESPVLFRGDATTAYRDPAAVWHDGWLYLYFTLVRTEPADGPFLRVAWTKSRDLRTWTKPQAITPRDRALNFSSPGNLVRFGGQWWLCLQTYPRPNGEKYGNSTSRLWTMRSNDLERWSPPELLRVKGPDVPESGMGRMIDPFLLADRCEPGKWWCFFKQNGVSRAWSRDLVRWTFAGASPAGENACIVVDGDEYVLFHSPASGIGVKRSIDLASWRDEDLLWLGRDRWPWAQGRLTAGFVFDARQVAELGRWIMLFHGSDYPETDPRGGFDNYASIGLAWSDDLRTWHWPGDSAR